MKLNKINISPKYLLIFVCFSALSVFLSSCAAKLTEQEVIKDNHVPMTWKNPERLKKIALNECLGFGYDDNNSIMLDSRLDNSSQNLALCYKNFDNESDNFTSLSSISTIFNDENLDVLLKKADEKNTNVLILASKIIQARANAKIALGNMFPTVARSVSPQYQSSDRQSVNPEVNSVDFSASLSWEIDYLGKLNDLRLGALENVRSAEELLSSAKVSLYADVASYYYNIQNISNNIEISKKLIENLRAIRDVLEAKYEMGLTDSVMVLSAEMSLLDEENNLKTLETNLEVAKGSLGVILDENYLDNYTMNVSWRMPSVYIPALELVPADVILNRPDVRAQIYSVNQAIYSAMSAKKALSPTITINANLGQILASTASSGPGALIWQVVGSIAAPLLNRQNLYATATIQEEAKKQAAYSLQNVINQAFSDIEISLYKTDSTQKALYNSITYYNSSNSTLSLNQMKTEEGLSDRLSFLTAQNQTLNAQRSLCLSQINYISAVISLYKAFGGSFKNEMKGL